MKEYELLEVLVKTRKAWPGELQRPGVMTIWGYRAVDICVTVKKKIEDDSSNQSTY